jgi:voltage-gated potassium channel
MTADSYQDLPRTPRRRVILRAVVRGFLNTALLVVVYYVLPLDERFGADAAVRVLIGLVVFAGMTAWQVKTIIDSPYPATKAFEALGLILPFYLLLFASTYFVMERTSTASFTEPMTRTDALYFSVTVFSTVGFGDIAPRSEAARIALIFQMLGDLALLGAGARLLLVAVQHGRQRRSDAGSDPGSADRPQ